MLRDMNVQGISNRDGRQLEVVANGLPLYGGAHLAVDATLVSPIRRNGTPQLGASTELMCSMTREPQTWRTKITVALMRPRMEPTTPRMEEYATHVGSRVRSAQPEVPGAGAGEEGLGATTMDTDQAPPLLQ